MEERFWQDAEAWRWIDSSRRRFGHCRRGFPDPSERGKSATPECEDSRGEASGMRLDAFGRIIFRTLSPTGKDADLFVGLPFVRAG